MQNNSYMPSAQHRYDLRSGESTARLPDRSRSFQVAAQPTFTFRAPPPYHAYESTQHFIGHRLNYDEESWSGGGGGLAAPPTSGRSGSSNLARPALPNRPTTASTNQRQTKEYQDLLKKYDARGLTIGKHEGRFKDANDLLPQMKRRLDPANKTQPILSHKALWQDLQKQSKKAFSKDPAMQSHYDFLVAYDYLMDKQGGSSSMGTASGRSQVNDDRRFASMAATIKLQASLIREQSERISNLNELLAEAHCHSHTVAGHNSTFTSESGAGKPVRSVEDINKLLGKKPARSRKRNAPASKENELVQQTPLTFAPPENHTSLTFQGFSQENQMNPARLNMLGAASSPSASQSPEQSAPVGPKQTGANMAPLAFDRRRLGSSDQKERAHIHSAPAFGSASSPHDECADFGSKRAMPFLDYDDGPASGRGTPNKRIKSGALTPPPLDELCAGSTTVAEQADVDTDAGVLIKSEPQDLEMGGIASSYLTGDLTGAGNAGSYVVDAETSIGCKYAYDELDKMIINARTEAGSDE